MTDDPSPRRVGSARWITDPAPEAAPLPASAPQPPGRRLVVPARRWPRRLLVVLNVFVAVCLLSVGAGYGYVRIQLSRVKRQNFGAGVLRTDSPGSAMNVLLVGSDTRAALDPSEKQFGSAANVAGQRSDVIMILHADPREQKAAILSLPRDLYVPIAGTSRTDRINSSFDQGPAALIQTIDQDLGIPIDHYVEVNFDGFRSIVDAVGGIDVYFPAPARDAYSNLNIAQAGCVHLPGAGALAYVRSRHYQYYEAGRWHDDPTSDFGRIQRQQDFIRRVLGKVKGVRNPGTLNSLITSGIKDVTIDNALGLSDILKLANRFKSLSPDTVDMLTLPTTPTTVRLAGSTADVLKLKEPDAQAVIDRFTGKTPPPAASSAAAPPGVAPASVRVRVLNGAGTSGLASRVATELRDAGFNVAGTGDADNFNYTTSTITYGPGQQDKAKLLAASIDGATQLRADPTLRAVDVVLAVGSTFTAVHAATAAPPASTTTTTAPAASPGKATGKSPAASC